MDTIQPEYKPVYILGAGVSSYIGGPLLKDFMTRARDLRYAGHFRDERARACFDQVIEYQGRLLKSKAFIGSDLDNLENLFSMLDMEFELEKVNLSGAGSAEVSRLRESFFTLVISTLRECISKEHPRWGTYVKIIRYLAGPENSCFITFNYDLAIERALSTPTAPGASDCYLSEYNTKQDIVPSPDSRLVLKLHGSANWVTCLSCHDFTAMEEYMLPIELESNRHRLHNQMKCTATNQFINVLIPPSWSKANYIHQITRVWRRSVQEISQATHIFVMGYSFPRTDLFFDQLMGLALRESKNLRRIVVVNPDKGVGSILEKFFEPHFRSNRVIFLPMGFGKLSLNTRYDLATARGMDAFIDALNRTANQPPPDRTV